MNGYRHSGRFLAVMTFAACLGFAAAPRAIAAESAAPLPVLGVDPLPQGTVMENHDCALQHWIERGFTGAVLLHIDTHDDLRVVPAERLSTLRALYARGETSAMARKGCGGSAGLFNEGNYLRAAAELGVVREIVWVMPFTFLQGDDSGIKLLSYLENAGFPKADRETFRLVDGWYRGTVGGIPVTLCDQERLPKLAEPVLLSIDVDFFPFAAVSRGRTPLGEIRALFQALREVRYAVRDVVLTYSVQGGFMPVDLRWVGDAVLEALRNPAIYQGQRPPERWENLQHLALLHDRGREGEAAMMSMALALVEKQPHDPALLLYAALATVGHGGDSALKYAEEACEQDRGYCVGLRVIGLQYLEQGDVETGVRCYTAGERLLPGMTYGQFERGIALLEAGRTPEALAVFEEISAREGAFPIGLLIGEIQLSAGDRAAARRSFDKVLAVIEQAPNVGVSDEMVAEAVRRAAVFYREEGLTRQAQLLETDPRLRRPITGEKP